MVRRLLQVVGLLGQKICVANPADVPAGLVGHCDKIVCGLILFRCRMEMITMLS